MLCCLHRPDRQGNKVAEFPPDHLIATLPAAVQKVGLWQTSAALSLPSLWVWYLPDVSFFL